MTDQKRVVTTQSIAQAEGRLEHRPSGATRLRQNENARGTLSIITLLPIFLIGAMTIALIVRSWPIISAHSLKDTVFGIVWKPEQGSFGFWPFIMGTVWVTVVGLLLAVPPCLLVALYLSEYAHNATRAVAKPVLDLLAAIPPVVYGVWGLLAV